MDMIWAKHRTDTGHIDLLAAFEDIQFQSPKHLTEEQVEMAKDFLRTMMDLRPVGSRQIAALALAVAVSIPMVASNEVDSEEKE